MRKLGIVRVGGLSLIIGALAFVAVFAYLAGQFARMSAEYVRSML